MTPTLWIAKGERNKCVFDQLLCERWANMIVIKSMNIDNCFLLISRLFFPLFSRGINSASRPFTLPLILKSLIHVIWIEGEKNFPFRPLMKQMVSLSTYDHSFWPFKGRERSLNVYMCSTMTTWGSTIQWCAVIHRFFELDENWRGCVGVYCHTGNGSSFILLVNAGGRCNLLIVSVKLILQFCD